MNNDYKEYFKKLDNSYILLRNASSFEGCKRFEEAEEAYKKVIRLGVAPYRFINIAWFYENMYHLKNDKEYLDLALINYKNDADVNKDSWASYQSIIYLLFHYYNDFNQIKLVVEKANTDEYYRKPVMILIISFIKLFVNEKDANKLELYNFIEKIRVERNLEYWYGE